MSAERIKVCFFSGFFPNWPGGAEYQAYMLAKSLDSARYDVFFISIGGHESGEYRLGGYPVHFLNPPRGLSKLGKPLFLLRGVIRRILSEEGPDIVYQRGGYAATGILAKLSKRIGFKFVWACASDRDLSRSVLREGLRPFNHINRFLRIRGIRNADLVLAQTHDQARVLKRDFARDGIVLRNAHPALGDVSDKEIEGLKVLFIANLKPLKQPEIFIDLAQRLREMSHVEFVIIGRGAGGKWQRMLETRVQQSDNLSYLGQLTQEEVNCHLERGHILVNTSQYEGFSNTFIQAWMRKVPVVSLNVDPDRLLSEGNLGFCSRDFYGLCRDVRRLIVDRSLRESIGEKARRYACEHHAIEKVGRQFQELVEGMVAEGK